MRLASLSLSLIGLALAGLLFSRLTQIIPVPPGSTSMGVRLGIGCAALLPGAGVLMLMILAQMALRFVGGAFDPTLGRDGQALVLNQRAISNSVEQMVAFSPALLALASGAGSSAIPSVIALGATFGAARIAFWAGYAIHPVGRAPGMAATAGCVLGAWGAAVWVWLA